MNEIQELCTEASEILKNAWMAFQNEEITEEQYLEVRNNTLLDVGYKTEIISQPRPS